MGFHVGVLSAVLAAAVLVSPAGAQGLEPGRNTITIPQGDYQREYSIHVPEGYRAGQALPLVLLLHGAGGSGATMLDRNGWAAKADREGFVAVAPDGLPAFPDRAIDFRRNPRVWNSGQLRADSPRAAVDDVRFLTAVLDDVARRVSVSPSRVFAAGHSNGGGMTFRLAAEQPRRLAAIASVSALCWVDNPRPGKAIPTLVIVGREDPLVPLAGGRTRSPWGDAKLAPAVAQNLAMWAKALGAPAAPVTVKREPGVEVQRYGPAGGKALLTIEYLEGHGHMWPGLNEQSLPTELVGPVGSSINATDVIWDFFAKVGDPNPSPVRAANVADAANARRANPTPRSPGTDPSPPPPPPVPRRVRSEDTPPPPPTPDPSPARKPEPTTAPKADR